MINTHYIQCGGTRLCIRSSLLCEPVSLRVATSCDAVSSRNRQEPGIKYCTNTLCM
jgi:hypothetical protein